MAKNYAVKSEKKGPIYERLAEELYERMVAGTAPWQPGFTGSYELPTNFITGDEYRGMNILKLAMGGVTRAATFNQIVEYAKKQRARGVQEADCIHLRKGSKGHEIARFVTFEIKGASSDTPEKGAADAIQTGDGQGTALMGQSMRSYYVFKIEDCDNVPPELMAQSSSEERAVKGMQFADDIIEGLKASGLRFVESGDQPCYVPSLDEIRMPPRHRYHDDAAWAADALHEGSHSTMHQSRLDRPDGRGHKPRSPGYAREELRAEISAFFTACRTGHRPPDSHFGSHASYTKHYLDQLGGDKGDFMKAVGEARDISNYLIGLGLEVQQRREASLAEQAPGLTAESVAAPFDAADRIEAPSIATPARPATRREARPSMAM